VPEAEIAACLGELGLGESLPLPVSDFSGGMRRRVALARALLYGGELYVLDEPFKGLDDTTKKSVTETLLKYTKGKTVLCVTHDAEDAFLLGADIIEIPSL